MCFVFVIVICFSYNKIQCIKNRDQEALIGSFDNLHGSGYIKLLLRLKTILFILQNMFQSAHTSSLVIKMK